MPQSSLQSLIACYEMRGHVPSYSPKSEAVSVILKQPLIISSAQLAPQDLAHRRARNALHQHVFLGPLEVGQPRRAHMCIQSLDARALSGRLDKGDELMPP